jgi:hypothetical protein
VGTAARESRNHPDFNVFSLCWCRNGCCHHQTQTRIQYFFHGHISWCFFDYFSDLSLFVFHLSGATVSPLR